MLDAQRSTYHWIRQFLTLKKLEQSTVAGKCERALLLKVQGGSGRFRSKTACPLPGRRAGLTGYDSRDWQSGEVNSKRIKNRAKTDLKML